MHYLNLMTIRLYTLLAVLPNRILGWLHHSFNLAALPSSFPNLSDLGNGHAKTLSYLYQHHPDVAQFYVNFGKYLRPTRPIYTVFAHILGKGAEWLYDITNDLERAYVSLFKIFGLITSDSNIGKWFKYVQYASLAVFTLLLIIYGVGMIFSLKGGFARMKNFITGIMIATAFIGVLPITVNAFSTGIQKVADVFVGDHSGNNTQSMLATGNTSGKGSESVGDSIVKNNIVSIPSATTYAGEHGQTDINVGAHVKDHIFTPTHQQFSSQVPEQSYYVNLYHMPNDEKAGQKDITQYRDAWNGIGDGSPADFLGNVGGSGSYLDKNTIRQNTDKVQDDMHTQPGLFNQFKAGFGHILNGTDKLAAKLSGSSTFSQSESEEDNAGNYTTDFNNYPGARFYLPYQYFVQGTGSDAQFKPLGQFGSGSSFGTGFHQSYGTYSINWLNIYLGLITLIFLLFALIVKVTNSFYKLVIMYVTSGWFLVKNAAQHDKIKDFIKAFFGIFENLVLDMLFLRLFIIVYLDVNSAIARLPFSPILLGILQVMATIGLYKVENKGIETISSQISGQGNKTGNGFGSLAAAATGGLALSGAHKIGRGLGHTARGAKRTGAAGVHVAKGKAGGWQRSRNHRHPNDHNPNALQRGRNKLESMTGSNGSRDGSARTSPGGDNSPGSGSQGSPSSSGGKQNISSQGKGSGNNNISKRGQSDTSGSTDTGGSGIDNTPRPSLTTGEKVGSVLGYATRSGLAGLKHRFQGDYYATNMKDTQQPHYTGHPGNNSTLAKKQNGSGAQKMQARQEQRQKRHAAQRKSNQETKQRYQDSKKKVKNNRGNGDNSHDDDNKKLSDYFQDDDDNQPNDSHSNNKDYHRRNENQNSSGRPGQHRQGSHRRGKGGPSWKGSNHNRRGDDHDHDKK